MKCRNTIASACATCVWRLHTRSQLPAIETHKLLVGRPPKISPDSCSPPSYPRFSVVFGIELKTLHDAHFGNNGSDNVGPCRSEISRRYHISNLPRRLYFFPGSHPYGVQPSSFYITRCCIQRRQRREGYSHERGTEPKQDTFWGDKRLELAMGRAPTVSASVADHWRKGLSASRCRDGCGGHIAAAAATTTNATAALTHTNDLACPPTRPRL